METRKFTKSLIVAAALLTVSTFAALAQTPAPERSKTYRIDSWPDGLKTVPCDAFVPVSSGGWSLDATIIAPHHIEAFNTYGSGPIADIIEAHCGKH
jgi:hypothetical protein